MWWIKAGINGRLNLRVAPMRTYLTRFSTMIPAAAHSEANLFLSCCAICLNGSWSAWLRLRQRWPKIRFHSLFDIWWEYSAWKDCHRWSRTTGQHNSNISGLAVVSNKLARLHRKEIVLTHGSLDPLRLDGSGSMFRDIERCWLHSKRRNSQLVRRKQHCAQI